MTHKGGLGGGGVTLQIKTWNPPKEVKPTGLTELKEISMTSMVLYVDGEDSLQTQTTAL